MSEWDLAVEAFEKLEAGDFWRRVISRKQVSRQLDDIILECGHHTQRQRIFRALGDRLLCADCGDAWLEARRRGLEVKG